MSGTKRGRLLAKTGVLVEKKLLKNKELCVGALKKNVEKFDQRGVNVSVGVVRERFVSVKGLVQKNKNKGLVSALQKKKIGLSGR